MALYPKAVKRLIPPGPNDPKITARLAILHVAVMIGSLYDYFKDRSGGIESHFYVFKNGTVEQYRDTAYQADANCDANDFAVSIESEGMAEGEWTPEQIAAIKELLLWLHEVHDIPLVAPTKWNGSGVGYHILFMQEWAGGPRSCPGPDRIKQFENVLVPWMASGGSEDDVTPEDIKAIADEVWTKDQTKKGTIGGTDANETPLTILTRMARNIEAIAAIEKAQVAQVAAAVVAAQKAANQPTVDVDALARAIVVQLTKES